MPTDTSLIAFKAISDFTNDLGCVFSDNQRSLKLYSHLINKTTLSHENPIKKHIEAFRLFCVSNRTAIAERDSKQLGRNRITYSKRVFINMKEIFKVADRETTKVIWKHLLTISALVDPEGNARDILKDEKENDNETNFLANIVDRMDSEVDTNGDPAAAIASVMQSGLLSDLVSGLGSGLQDGSLDLGKLMGSVQSLVANSSEGDESEGGGMPDIAGMLGPMMSALTGGGSKSGEGDDGEASGDMPDIAGMLGPMLSGLMGGGDSGGDGGDGGDNGDMPDIAGMLGPVMGALSDNKEGGEGEMPDISSMLGPVMGAMMGGGDNGGIAGMLSSMTEPSQTIEEKVNAQLQLAKDDGNF